jgi:tetratricopeptide (TPR) repeat protein
VTAGWYEWGMGWKMATFAAVLWVIALTVWAAVAAGVVKGPAGVVTGATLTALAAVAAGYVPGIRDVVLRRRAELARLEAEEAADQEALRQARELPGFGPAGLLDPRRGLVSFTGRAQELAVLLAWCQDGVPRGVQLVTGPGGVGKTRLSVELCSQLDPDRWRCVRVGDREESRALEVARRGWPGRVLLVIDYAETRLGLGDLLRAVAADPGPVRVLLLARSAGEWRDRLAAAEPAVRELLAEAGGDEPLGAAVSRELSNADLVRAAVPVFANALGMRTPEQVVVDAGSGAVRMLDLHAAALVAVLRSGGAGQPMRVRVGNVLDELLGHEERFWQGTAEQRGLLGGLTGMDTTSLRQIVAVGALLGAESEDEAVELLGRVPGVVPSVQVARWLRDLYPPPEGRGGTEWLGSLRPDRLAERLVVAQLTKSPELAGRCLSGLDERQALRAITLLGRAAADEQDAEVLLERVLPLVERVVVGLPDDLRLLTAISDAIPYPSDALAQADLAVTRRILQVLPVGNMALRARWLIWLSATLSQTGRLTEAVPPAQQAVDAYRELAAAYPDRYRPALAGALSELSSLYSELGRHAEALPLAEQAVEIRRELAAANPDRYRPALAGALGNLSNRFSGLGRHAEALPPAQQAVDVYRELAAAYPDRYLPYLALSLSNLSLRFSELGRHAEALPPAQQAVEIRRELAAAYPDQYRSDLAASLSNLSVAFTELGRQDEALPPAQQAVDVYRELAAAYPDRYRSSLARSLDNLGGQLWRIGRLAEVLPLTQEAAAIYRELVDYSDRYRAELATSLANLGVAFSELGRSAEALTVEREAVDVYRELASAYPDRYRPDLARTLANLGAAFSDLGRSAEALTVEREAIDIRRELAAAYPDRYRPDLANLLSNLGATFSELGRPAEALTVEREAVDVYRELAAAYPDRYRPDLARSLSNLADTFSELGRHAEALPLAQQAVDVYRELAAAYPDRYRSDLARSLSVLADVLDGIRSTAKP